MIHLLDEIVLPAERIGQVLALLETDYLPGAQRRGLTLIQRWVSPPVAIAGQPNSLWLLWQLPDAGSYYHMRGSAGAEVVEFWSAVDGICNSRRRQVLTAADQPLPQAPEADHAS